eukprot:5982743-Pyramimonas_sp.AAC.1
MSVSAGTSATAPTGPAAAVRPLGQKNEPHELPTAPSKRTARRAALGTVRSISCQRSLGAH